MSAMKGLTTVLKPALTLLDHIPAVATVVTCLTVTALHAEVRWSV